MKCLTSIKDDSDISEDIEESKDENGEISSSDEKQVFWEDSKEDGSLIAIQSIFDSLEDWQTPSQSVPIKHRRVAL